MADVSVTLKTAMLGTVESTIGTGPKLQIRTGSKPSACADSASGTLLCEITLPSDWLTAPSGGSASKVGTWSGTAVATGTAGHWRIYDSAGSVCHMQGTIGLDMTLDNTSITSGQTITINSATLS